CNRLTVDLVCSGDDRAQLIPDRLDALRIRFEAHLIAINANLRIHSRRLLFKSRDPIERWCCRESCRDAVSRSACFLFEKNVFHVSLLKLLQRDWLERLRLPCRSSKIKFVRAV